MKDVFADVELRVEVHHEDGTGERKTVEIGEIVEGDIESFHIRGVDADIEM